MRRPRIYADTNVFVAAMEAADRVRDRAREIFALRDAGEIDVVTSESTLSELLVHPIKVGDIVLIDAYEQQIASLGPDHAVPVTIEILRDAAALRARSGGLKLPDAVHVATALRAGCDAVLAEDRRLGRFHGIPVLGLEPDSLAAFFIGYR